MNVGYTWPALPGEIKELPVASIPVEKSRLLVFFRGAAGVYFGINVTVGNDQIFPSVIIEVEKCRPPSQIFCVHRETRADGIVLEVICALVFVHGVGVVGEVRLENVEQTIAVEIRGSGAHTSLFASIFVVRKAGADSDLFEPLSANIVVVQTRSRVRCHKDVRPTIIIEVSC